MAQSIIHHKTKLSNSGPTHRPSQIQSSSNFACLSSVGLRPYPSPVASVWYHPSNQYLSSIEIQSSSNFACLSSVSLGPCLLIVARKTKARVYSRVNMLSVEIPDQRTFAISPSRIDLCAILSSTDKSPAKLGSTARCKPETAKHALQDCETILHWDQTSAFSHIQHSDLAADGNQMLRFEKLNSLLTAVWPSFFFVSTKCLGLVK